MKETTRAVTASVFIILASAGCIIHAQQAGNSKQTPRPSLEDTEAWIVQTFTSHTGRSDCQEYDPFLHNGTYGSFFNCYMSGYLYVTFNQCEMSFAISYSTGGLSENGPVQDEWNGKDVRVVSFSLSDIDPTTIKAGAPHGQWGDLNKKTYHDNPPSYLDVSFGTTDEINKIAVEHLYDKTSYNKPEMLHDCCGLLQPGVAVQPDYAPRFVKAFRNAVELCGGKPPTF